MQKERHAARSMTFLDLAPLPLYYQALHCNRRSRPYPHEVSASRPAIGVKHRIITHETTGINLFSKQVENLYLILRNRSSGQRQAHRAGRGVWT